MKEERRFWRILERPSLPRKDLILSVIQVMIFCKVSCKKLSIDLKRRLEVSASD